MPRRPQNDSLTGLQKALQASRTSGARTNQELASAAGVSTRTLQLVITGEFAKKAKPSPKELRGYAESLTRLSLYCELSPEKVLAEYGIKPEPDVLAAVERVRARTAPHGALLDPSLDRIFARGGGIRAGILLWEPFAQILDGADHPRHGSNRTARELTKLAEESWAWCHYTRQLLGTVNPLWGKEPRGIETITEAIDAVLTRGKDECELVFGVYDTAYRRTRGLAFVPLPGLGVPLGLVHGGQSRDLTDEELADLCVATWEALLDGGDDYRALSLREEAGHLFLAGVCGFREGTGTTGKALVTIDEGHTAALAFHFLKDLVESRPIGDARKRIFVADMPTCRRLFLETRNVKTLLLQQGIDDARSRALYQEAADTVHLLPPMDVAPVYPIGIAIRADSPRWEELLRTATQELFRNSTSLVARSYARLLTTGASMLRPLPFESDILPNYYAKDFVEKVTADLQGDNCGDWLKVWSNGNSNS